LGVVIYLEIRGMNMSEKKSILYVQTSDIPERQYSPLVLAQTAKAMGIDAKVYYLGQGLKVLLPGIAEKIKSGSFPSVREMIDKTLAMGIQIFVCEASKQMFGWEKVDLIPGLKIVGAATLNDLVLESDKSMWF
jgi:predicted peroxiredoxin